MPEIRTERDVGTLAQLSLSRIMERVESPRVGRALFWGTVFTVSFSLFALLLVSVTYLFVAGVGIWGVDIPVAWGVAIASFVWWIGIGHAGTLISAVLLVFRQEWRASINRLAEAMTLFAVACAGLYPILHLGRPGLFYWLIPYPNTMGIWPQFRSPLVFDVFAISTYAVTSLLFWYMALIPDLAKYRDRAQSRRAFFIYGVVCLGWRGTHAQWRALESSALILAAIATPLVVSVHSIVGFDFAASIVPGWHSTIFPPYFVAGAVFSGMAMVLTLVIPLRRVFSWEAFITLDHLDKIAKVMLASGLIVAYGYMAEIFTAYTAGNQFEKYVVENRMHGPYAAIFWTVMICNVVATQALWSPTVRRSKASLFGLSIVINIGMWLERYMIVVTSLHRDFLPSSWGMYSPTFWDWSTLAGTAGLFLSLLFLFVRFLPAIAVFELGQLKSKETG